VFTVKDIPELLKIKKLPKMVSWLKPESVKSAVPEGFVMRSVLQVGFPEPKVTVYVEPELVSK
jgi:hypothetical protein